jgi:hypothetical protein
MVANVHKKSSMSITIELTLGNAQFLQNGPTHSWCGLQVVGRWKVEGPSQKMQYQWEVNMGQSRQFRKS